MLLLYPNLCLSPAVPRFKFSLRKGTFQTNNQEHPELEGTHSETSWNAPFCSISSFLSETAECGIV